MNSDVRLTETFIEGLPEDRKEPMQKLRKVIRENLPEGFEETMAYGMLTYVVPLSRYPAGYLGNPAQPLPFISLASQKNHIAFYHMGVYSNEEILKWFEEEYRKRVPTKLDMGKSCVRFRNTDNIPYDLIGELCKKITVEDWIAFFEESKKDKEKSRRARAEVGKK